MWEWMVLCLMSQHPFSGSLMMHEKGSEPSGLHAPERAVWDELQAVLEGSVWKRRFMPLFTLTLFLVMLAIVMLPVIYVGMIAAVGWGMYWYASDGGLTLFDSHGSVRLGIWRLGLYIGPLIAGLILVLMMLKPFFAPRHRPSVGPTLLKQDQPLLFAYVERLCHQLGVPVPKRIDVTADVNASASFREGWWSFFRGDLVLTLGLPLVASLTVQQLTGVIAHELGHFRQAMAMRMSSTILRINGWFARMVYERDDWDEAIDSWMEGGVLITLLIAMIVKLSVWMTRWILWAFLMVAHGLSCFLLRRMEYDADAVSAYISGSDHVGPTLGQMGLLYQMQVHSLHQPDARLGQRELIDNLPSYVSARFQLIPEQSRQMALNQAMEEQTGWFSTHPGTGQRHAFVMKLGEAGLVRSDRPARSLFRDFGSLCKVVTYSFYRDHLGENLSAYTLVDSGRFVKEIDDRHGRGERVKRFLDADWGVERTRVFFDETASSSAGMKEALMRWREAWGEREQRREEACRAYEQALSLRREYARIQVATWLHEFGVEPSKAQLSKELDTAEKAQAAQRDVEDRLVKLDRVLEGYGRHVGQRLMSAVVLLGAREIRERVKDAASLQRDAFARIEKLRELESLPVLLDDVVRQQHALGAWLGVAELYVGRKESLRSQVERLDAAIAKRMRDIEVLVRSVVDVPVTEAKTEVADENQEGDAYALNEEQVNAIEDEKKGIDRGRESIRMANEHRLELLSDLVAIAEKVEGVVARLGQRQPGGPQASTERVRS